MDEFRLEDYVNSKETVWRIAMEMSRKISELTGDPSIGENYRNRLSDAYKKEEEERRRIFKEYCQSDYF